MKKFFSGVPLLLLLAACHNQSDKKEAVRMEAPPAAHAAAPDLRKLHFAADKDLACGMPIKAGVSDTVTYKGKLYGFCSPECKDAFLKDAANLTANIK